MNKNTLKTSLRMMIVLGALVLIAQGVSAEANVDADGVYDDWGKYMGAGIALGLAAVGAGISQAAIGSAAVGMIAEDGSKFGTGILFTVIPETIVLFGFLTIYLL